MWLYNAYFYCMMMLGICLITFLDTVTKRRKNQTKEKKITPFVPLNDSTSPSNERNGKYTFSPFQEEVQHEEQGMSIILNFAVLDNYKF